MSGQLVQHPTEPSAPDDPPGAAPNLREQLLPDIAFEEEMADALDCSRRTVQRLGLPYVRIGKRRGYSVSRAREELKRRIAQGGGP
jgi:hypothetical protein